MSIKMRMFSTLPNRNAEAVTEAFIDEIATQQDKYLCTPLLADVAKLTRKEYRGLGHMHDAKSGTFLTQQIGSFYAFEKVNDEYGVSLIGEARIAKRRKEVCEALRELYEAGNLNFSFEIITGKLEERDGVVYIDASDSNMLIGMAVVSIPAYPEAKALELVAEVNEAEMMERAFERTANFYAGEISTYTLHRWVWDALRHLLGENWCDVDIEKVCVDCVILYHTPTAKMYKMEYVVSDNGLIVTDFYEVEYRRKGDEKMAEETKTNMNTTKVEAEVKTEPVEAPEQAEMAKEAVATEGAVAQTEQPADNRVAQLEAELATLRAENERLRGEKEAAALESKRAELRKYASESGLDMEDSTVAEAIAAVNYEALVAQVMKAKSERVQTASGTRILSDIGVEDTYGGILRRVK